MFAWSVLCLMALGQQPPPPPYVRVGTYSLGEFTRASLVGDGVLYYVQGEVLRALDLATGKPIWHQALVGSVKLATDGHTLFACSGSWDNDPAWVFALDPNTGSILWKLPRKGPASPMAVSGDRLFLSMAQGTLSALDLKTRQAVWRIDLPRPPRQASDSKEEIAITAPGPVNAVTAENGRVVANSGSITSCFDARTGASLWQEGESAYYDEPIVTARGVVLVKGGKACVGRDLASGKVLWRVDQMLGTTVSSLEGAFAMLSQGNLIGLDPSSGKTLWSHGLGSGPFTVGRRSDTVLGGVLFARGWERMIAVDGLGKELWSCPEDQALASPIWTDGRQVVCFDGQRLFRYVPGTRPALPTQPTARTEVAGRLIAKFEDLDAEDLARLASLGDDAFEPLLRAFLGAAKAQDSRGASSESSRYESLASVLKATASNRRGDDLLAALAASGRGSSAKPTLIRLLAQFGDPDKYIPYLLKELEVPTPGFEFYDSSTYVSRMIVAHSNHPLAVRYMIGQLKDPKGDTQQRFDAYVNLAASGNEEAVAAVLAERSERTLLAPLEERLDLAHVGGSTRDQATSILRAQKTDANGVTWGLLSVAVLGSDGDLWLVRKEGDAWTHPRFAGVSREAPSSWANPPPPVPTFAGKTGKELADGAWFDALVGNPALDSDADGDGLTDLVEARLGTDPKRADTDGDGDPDGVDPWPNAQRRPESDAEKVLAAVFEARYHFFGGDQAGIFFAPADMEPFEMVGWRGPVIWKADAHDWSTPLEQCYEQGVAFIRFTGGRGGEDKPWEEQMITWNKDRTEASTLISTYFGGLSGTGYSAIVRKIGDRWVVVSMRMAYVS
ncbi:MAG: PQQ-like beta-propeller repeat protein [Chthonomonadaceae bacterium]|nr:PQQ-like beta-propeller repeat protein [Chthonomonadaceae bacterium]